MPKFISPIGQEVSRSEALTSDDYTLRPGYREIVANGEAIRFNPFLLDAAARSTDTVFLTDATVTLESYVQERIAQLAKIHSQKPAEFLAALPLRELTKLVAKAAGDFIEQAGSSGVASALSVDSPAFVGAIDRQHAMHDAKFDAIPSAPAFDRERAKFLFQSALDAGLQAARFANPPGKGGSSIPLADASVANALRLARFN